jgi:phosphatidylglycerol---prolipoprotein diacylglyceryl transferase
VVITIDVDPVLLHIGPLSITWYALAVLAGLWAAVWLTRREAGRKGVSPNAIMSILPWALLGGLIGARALHVIDRWDFYSANPGHILAFQNGGLAILGAILGGSLAGGIAAWRAGLPVRRLFDAAAPGIVLGQAIGRFGCLVTGDALGPATGGGWGIIYRNPGAMAPELGVAYQPTFLYEQVWDLAVFSLLWALRRRLTSDGQLFALYLGLYAAGKFALTFLRTEQVWLWGLQQAQLLALGALAVAVVWAIWGRLVRPGQQARTA